MGPIPMGDSPAAAAVGNRSWNLDDMILIRRIKCAMNCAIALCIIPASVRPVRGLNWRNSAIYWKRDRRWTVC
jgi:hypothetical protein